MIPPKISPLLFHTFVYIFMYFLMLYTIISLLYLKLYWEKRKKNISYSINVFLSAKVIEENKYTK